MGISRFTAPGTLDPLGPQRCSRFNILPVKIFSLKQRTKTNTSSYYRKNHIFTLQENSLWFL